MYAIAKKFKWQSKNFKNIKKLKLEKKLKNILEILGFFVYIEQVKFQVASFNSN